MDYSSDQNQDYVFWHGVDPSWPTPDHAVSALEEEFHPEQEPQLTPIQHIVQPFDPPMDPFPAVQFSTLTPVPMDVAPDLGFPSATPPEGPAGESADPEHAHGVGWNVEGERLANDIKYEHGLGLYFEEPLIEGLDVNMLDFEPAPAATAAVIAATAEQAKTGPDSDKGAAEQEAMRMRDTVSSRPRQEANAKRRKSAKSIPCPRCTVTFTRQHNLDEHMKLHANKKEYHCTVGDCGWRFNTSGGLRSHKKHAHYIYPSSTD